MPALFRLLLLLAPLLVSCESATTPAVATPTAQLTAVDQPTPVPPALTRTPASPPVATTTPVPPSAMSSFCATAPATPLPLEQLNLPLLPPGAAVLFSVQQSDASCLVALDEQGARVVEFPLAARGEWKWDARAGVLALRLQDTAFVALHHGALLWNRPFEQSETQRLAEAPEHGVFAYAFAPGGQQLAYLEVSPLPDAIAAWQLIRLDIATRQKTTLLTGGIYYMTPEATRRPVDLLKSPVGWSSAANRIYLLGIAPGDSPPESLWTIKPDGSDFRQALPFDGFFRGWIALSPDGRHLAYLALDPQHPIEPRLADNMFWPATNQLRVMDTQGGEVATLFTDTEGGLLRPPFLWAAAGRSILLGHSPKGSAGIYAGELMNVPIDGSGPRVIRRFDDTREWAADMLACPNGELLYVLARRDEAQQIVVSNLQGDTRTLLAVNPDPSRYVRVVGCFR